MTEDKIEPRPTYMFFVKNAITILKLMRSSTEKVIDFIENNERLQSAIYPNFEGFGSPMDEGMVYLLFNSDGDANPKAIDTVFRIFWVTAPSLRYHQLDCYLISTKFENKHWNRIYDDIEFVNTSKKVFHEEVSVEEADLFIHGTWDQGYTFQIEDRNIDFKGNLKLSSMDPRSTLVYYNGRTAIAPDAYQRFYDSFGLTAKGEININDETFKINGRSIIEHGIGIFGTKSFDGWHWLNIQLDKGAMHLFHHPIKRTNSPFKAGEGALFYDDHWYHILKDDFVIIEKEKKHDDTIDREIYTSWKVEINTPGENSVSIDLDINELSYLSWFTEVTSEETHFVTNYLLEVTGTINGDRISSRGTMEVIDIEVSSEL